MVAKARDNWITEWCFSCFFLSDWWFSLLCYKDFFLIQVLLAKHKAEEKFYAIKVLRKAELMKRNEVGVVL